MRLIDADKLKEYLQEYLHYEHAIPWIDAQPTAYDVEKVMDQLEEHFNATDDRDARLAYHHAIEIVKGSGVNNCDVCNYETNYRGSDKYKIETGCGYTFYDLHHAEPFKYCPYCGKKIKVVVE